MCDADADVDANIYFVLLSVNILIEFIACFFAVSMKRSRNNHDILFVVSEDANANAINANAIKPHLVMRIYETSRQPIQIEC